MRVRGLGELNYLPVQRSNRRERFSKHGELIARHAHRLK
jgi:hypothetical protein